MILLLILLTIIYCCIKQVIDRYHRVFHVLNRGMQYNPNKLAMALNPTWLAYMAMGGKIIGFTTLVLGVVTAQWAVVIFIVIYGLIGPVITEIFIPLPSQRWCLLRMKHELQRNIDVSKETTDLVGHMELIQIRQLFNEAMIEIKRQNIRMV